MTYKHKKLGSSQVCTSSDVKFLCISYQFIQFSFPTNAGVYTQSATQQKQMSFTALERDANATTKTSLKQHSDGTATGLCVKLFVHIH